MLECLHVSTPVRAERRQCHAITVTLSRAFDDHYYDYHARGLPFSFAGEDYASTLDFRFAHII